MGKPVDHVQRGIESALAATVALVRDLTRLTRKEVADEDTGGLGQDSAVVAARKLGKVVMTR